MAIICQVGEIKFNVLIVCVDTCSGFKWRLKRAFGLGSNPGKMPSLSIIPVQQCGVGSDPIVPNYHGSWSPFESALEILSLCNVVKQKFQQKPLLGCLFASLDIDGRGEPSLPSASASRSRVYWLRPRRPPRRALVLGCFLWETGCRRGEVVAGARFVIAVLTARSGGIVFGVGTSRTGSSATSSSARH